MVNTAVNKFVVALLGAAATIAASNGYDLGLDADTIAALAPLITAGLVYFIPNKGN